MRILLLLGLAACGEGGYGHASGVASSDAAAGGGSGAGQQCFSSNECPTGWTCSDFHVCEPPGSMGDGGVTPPETDYEFGQPTSSQRFVYVAMTAQNELARIDGRSLAVSATAVGKAPKDVATIPSTDGALVLDSTNGTATIVRPTGAGDIVKVLATLPNLNRVDVDPTGRYAVLWFDLAKQVSEGGLGGIGSFQDVTVIALAPGNEHAVNLTVGFRPRNVQFDAAGTRGYVVTQDGVSVIDLAYATGHEPSIVPPIAVADPTVPPDDLQVRIVATGDYAAVRQLNASALRVVSMRASDAGRVYTIPLASPASALELAPDGTRVYAVERTAKKLALIDIPGDAIDPTGVQLVDLATATLGSLTVSPDGTRALLYTNATQDLRLTMVKLDQAGFPQVTWPLKKGVRAVGVAPDGKSALVLHAKVPGDPSTATTIDDFIAMSYGYSLVDLASGFGKLEITTVDPGPFTYSPDGKKIYVALDGGDNIGATRAVQLVDVMTGVVTTKPLGSPPSAVGYLPDAAATFVAQRHPLGRVSFVDLATDNVRTVTGFDLNSHVVN